MFFEDYDAGLEKHCRELESSARTITGAEEKELFGKFFGQDPEKMTAEALSARDQIINANTDLAVALATKFAGYPIPPVNASPVAPPVSDREQGLQVI